MPLAKEFGPEAEVARVRGSALYRPTFMLSTGLPSCSLPAYLHALYRHTFMLCAGIPPCSVPAYRHALCALSSLLPGDWATRGHLRCRLLQLHLIGRLDNTGAAGHSRTARAQAAAGGGDEVSHDCVVIKRHAAALLPLP